MYGIISPHKGPTHCYASEASNTCVLCNLYDVHIFIFFYLYSLHFPSLLYFCMPWHLLYQYYFYLFSIRSYLFHEDLIIF